MSGPRAVINCPEIAVKGNLMTKLLKGLEPLIAPCIR